MLKQFLPLMLLTGCATASWSADCASNNVNGHIYVQKGLTKSAALSKAELGCRVSCDSPFCESKNTVRLICWPTGEINSENDALSLSGVQPSEALTVIERLGATAECSISPTEDTRY